MFLQVVHQSDQQDLISAIALQVAILTCLKEKKSDY